MDEISSELSRLVALFRHQHWAWLATAGPGEDLDAGLPEFDQMEETGDRILRLPCRNEADICEKIRVVLEFEALRLPLKEDTAGDGDVLRIFLLSFFPAAKFSSG